jgi:hypothetical protein
MGFNFDAFLLKILCIMKTGSGNRKLVLIDVFQRGRGQHMETQNVSNNNPFRNLKRKLREK